MNANSAGMAGGCDPRQVDEAAVWMTLLRAPDRNEQTERGFRRWLSASPSHAAAFEKVSTAWETTAAWPRGPFPRMSRWQRMGFRAGFVGAASAVAAAAALVCAGAWFYLQSSGVATGVGEQRMLALEDGSRVFLNTDTRVVVDYDAERRSIELKQGEALFEVGKRGPGWPFVVKVNGTRITALGTSFVVRRDGEGLSVTLIDGKVAVGADTPDAEATTLTPGQRLTLQGSGAPRVDSPVMEKVTAWRSGHVDFDEVPLAQAVAEMNRYSTVKLVIERAEAARIPITGTFRAGATESFATAVAEAYRLKLVENHKEITLAGQPVAPAGKQNLTSD